jgi:parallel beta-helix repeat protein
MSYCTVEYAGGGWWDRFNPAGIEINSSSVRIANSTARKHSLIGAANNGVGILINNVSPTITNSTIADNATDGVRITGDTAAPTITNSNITSNLANGISIVNTSYPVIRECTIAGNSGYGFSYAGQPTITATSNNWGSPSGPLDDSDDRASGGWYNPTGTGDRVSDRVMYDPWLGKPLTVTLTVQGSGKGTVTSDPAGIATNVSTTSTAYGYGDNLLLTAKADEYHLFSGWSGGCTNKTGNCAMTLTGDFAVTAAFDFDTLHAVRLNRPTPIYYPTLLEAYTNAANGDTIQAWATTYEEILNLNGNKRVTFSGGYDQGYTAVKGKTELKGKLTLGNGVTVLENIEVR